MKLIYVASPLRADDTEQEYKHIQYAGECCRHVISEKHAPFAPHLWFTLFFNDGNEQEREAGMLCGLEILTRCDELWVFADYGISEGMTKEIEVAQGYGIEVKYKKILKN